MDTVVTAIHFNLARLDYDIRIGLDALHAGIRTAGTAAEAARETAAHTAATATLLAALTGIAAEASLAAAGRNLDSRFLGCLALGNLHDVARANAVVCGRNRERAARNLHQTLTLRKCGCIVLIALDAIALRRVDGNVAAVDGDRRLALDTRICRGDVQRSRTLLDFQVVARVDTVIVVRLHGEAAASLDAQIVLRIDGRLRGVGLVVDRVGLATGRTVFNAVRRALDQVKFRLLGVLHIDGRIAALEGNPVQEQIYLASVGRSGIHDNLVIARLPHKVIVAGALDGNGARRLFQAAVVVRDGDVGAAERKRCLGAVQVHDIVFFGIVAAAIAREASTTCRYSGATCGSDRTAHSGADSYRTGRTRQRVHNARRQAF